MTKNGNSTFRNRGGDKLILLDEKLYSEIHYLYQCASGRFKNFVTETEYFIFTRAVFLKESLHFLTH